MANSGMSLGHNDGNYMLNAGVSGNAGVSIPRNTPDNGSSNFRMRSSPNIIDSHNLSFYPSAVKYDLL
ncbi:protein MEI2-like 2-like [Trifolium pratense]|uniref:Protein MEI2-like 2-like n=2 Tax=Trifolium pratense TaxID=57577 RepID=A0A2K3K763_TRIPR|nr:protein MEI2-like 2-like [Trifolium pratense]